MKRTSFFILIFLSLILLFNTTFVTLVSSVSGVSYAGDLKISELAKPVPDSKREIVVPDSEQKIATSGCCSWHRGVCDCILGRVICCDGTVSPTCLCNRESNEVMDLNKP